MSRLTKYCEYCVDSECIWYDKELAKDNKCECNKSRDNCHDRSIYNKLREYEDLEEQGLLLKLPVSLGQEVYRVNNIIIPMTVTEISYALTFRNEPRLIIQTEEKEYRGHNYYRVENIGNTVFLTKEEAEQELKRLESAEWQ